MVPYAPYNNLAYCHIRYTNLLNYRPLLYEEWFNDG